VVNTLRGNSLLSPLIPPHGFFFSHARWKPVSLLPSTCLVPDLFPSYFLFSPNAFKSSLLLFRAPSLYLLFLRLSADPWFFHVRKSDPAYFCVFVSDLRSCWCQPVASSLFRDASSSEEIIFFLDLVYRLQFSPRRRCLAVNFFISSQVNDFLLFLTPIPLFFSYYFLLLELPFKGTETFSSRFFFSSS